jgi:hypothetical protein
MRAVGFVVDSNSWFGFRVLGAGYTATGDLDAVVLHQESVRWLDEIVKLGLSHWVEIRDPAARQTSRMVMRRSAFVIACRGISIFQFGGSAAGNKRFEVLVDGCQTDPGNLTLDREEDLFGSGMMVDGIEVGEDSPTLPGEMSPIEIELCTQSPKLDPVVHPLYFFCHSLSHFLTLSLTLITPIRKVNNNYYS